MTASTNDFFKKTATSTVTTLSAPGKSLGATSINVGSTTNYPTDTGVIVSIRTVDTSGKLIAGTHTEWSGTVTSGTSLAIEAAPVYGSDQIYAAGSTTQVAIRLSSYSHNKLIDGLLVEHKQTGKHSDLTADSVKTDTITGTTDADSGDIYGITVTNGKMSGDDLADGSVTAAKLSTTAITLGYAEITSNFTSTAVATTTDITGMSVTVTVPDGGRRLKITSYADSINANGTVPKSINVSIREGSTTLARSNYDIYNTQSGYGIPNLVMASLVPTAGSHTYKISMIQTTAGTMTMTAAATYPAFILVELI